jgi:hypothetical protein
MTEVYWSIEKVQADVDALLDRLLIRKLPHATVIGVLRYGAHLPHIWSSKCALPGGTVPLILSHMVDFLPQDQLQNREFLVLDDSVYDGVQLQEHCRRLVALGVPPEKITSAAVVVRESAQCRPNEGNYIRILDDGAYAVWKKSLSRLVRGQRRSVDRDHPLYFFEITNCDSLKLLSVFQQLGSVTAVPNQSYGNVSAFSLTIDSAVLEPLIGDFAALRSEPICKVRFYWVEDDGRLSLTAVPIVFLRLNFTEFLSEERNTLFRLTGISISALDYLRQREDSFHRYVFYLATRFVAGKLLVKLWQTIWPILHSMGVQGQILDPDQCDFPIRYVFPETYRSVYASLFNELQQIIGAAGQDLSQRRFDFGWSCERLLAQQGSPYDFDACMPRKYKLLAMLTETQDCVRFDGKRWMAVDVPPKPVSALLSGMNDPLLVSRALDELLDVGLLRAKDGPSSGAPLIYERLIRPGGEFNALSVSNLASVFHGAWTGARPVNTDSAERPQWAVTDEY